MLACAPFDRCGCVARKAARTWRRSAALLPRDLLHSPASLGVMTTFLGGRWVALRRDPAGYTPFGAGPHICLGMGLAIAELRATLAMLARDGRRWEQVRGCVGFGGLWVAGMVGLRPALAILVRDGRRWEKVRVGMGFRVTRVAGMVGVAARAGHAGARQAEGAGHWHGCEVLAFIFRACNVWAMRHSLPACPWSEGHAMHMPLSPCVTKRG